MTTKLVIRLLDAAGSLIGWTEHQAAVPGDGTLRAAADVIIVASASGYPITASVHWADINTETRITIPAMPLSAGESLALFTKGSTILVVGQMPQNLAPVTVGRAVVSVPAGGVGAAV